MRTDWAGLAPPSPAQVSQPSKPRPGRTPQPAWPSPGYVNCFHFFNLQYYRSWASPVQPSPASPCQPAQPASPAQLAQPSSPAQPASPDHAAHPSQPVPAAGCTVGDYCADVFANFAQNLNSLGWASPVQPSQPRQNTTASLAQARLP
jgi:hypothetical protein